MRHHTSVLAFVSCLWLFAGWATGLQAKAVEWTAEPTPKAADSLLLEQYPNAYAAFSLRKHRADYDGPAIRVRRSTDGAEQDFGFGSDGKLDVSAIESWLGGADGYVTTWYNQVQDEEDLVQTDAERQPRIAEAGSVFTDSSGRVAIKFDRSRSTYLSLSSPLSNSYLIEESLSYVVAEKTLEARQGVYNLAQPEQHGFDRLRLDIWDDGGFKVDDDVSGTSWPGITNNPGWWAVNHNGSEQKVFGNNSLYEADEVTGSVTTDGLTVGVEAWTKSRGFDGYLTEVAVLPGQETEGDVQDVYDVVNQGWNLGPIDYHRDALLPQKEDWMVSLYNWLETLSVEDVTLPEGTLTYDNSYDSEDELADIWLKTRKLTASSVTRREPGWYVLDDGNGKGIEATGVVRANHEPKGNGDYGGNPPRSWQNEPAYWYKLDLPLASGGQGNPWYQDPAMGRRAMAVSIVDLIMHLGNWSEQGNGRFDMVGKAFLGMAEAYRWAGDVLSEEAREAYEAGMEDILTRLTEKGTVAVNTNMDMFALHGAAELYMATDDPNLQDKCVTLTRKALFGYPDGELETNHKVFAVGGRDGGVMDPSGFIMEGDQPDVFYGGESIHHLAGALEAVTDRQSGATEGDWAFLEEVVRRLQEWRSYQMFYDPGVSSPAVGGTKARTFVTAGAGFSGRTSYGVPYGQAGGPWKSMSIANRWDDHAFKGWVPGVQAMENGIAEILSTMNGEMSSNYTEGKANDWAGWSPWTKHTQFLPPEGWYSKLKEMQNTGDPEFKEPPAARKRVFWNKPMGGPPTGKEYWSYKQEDANGEEWGFFLEAQAQQGPYGGWYGGKIETFWSESTGVVLLNRHGKTGCDRKGVDDYSGSEDSTCWFNLDRKAGHHVWGRDENGNGFTTLLLRGRSLNRTSTFDTGGSPPTVTVNNVFNDPSQPSGKAGESGEQTGSEIEGSFEVENKFEAQSDGLKVTHTLTSDQSDQVTELWASLPVYLRHYNPHRGGDQMQSNLEDTSIEYWDGSQWLVLPEDTTSDGVPEIVSTDALRLGRNFLLGDGIQYVYIDLANTQDVRRSTGKYYDPYQSRTGVRTVHVDLHGNPGTEKTLPAEKSVSYTIQTTDPTSGDTSASQVIPLQKGWNIVSTFVSPAAPAMDSVFADLQSEITVVKNEAGERYRPNENINEIGQWNSEEAYRVYAESDAILSIQGDSLGSPSIALEEGWNLVPYFPSGSLPVEEVLSSIVEDLGRVKDETGRAYLPNKDPDVLEQMEPGKGYEIHVRQSTTLTYPDGGN